MFISKYLNDNYQYTISGKYDSGKFMCAVNIHCSGEGEKAFKDGEFIKIMNDPDKRDVALQILALHMFTAMEDIIRYHSTKD